ncbi:MAG: C-GCAxxG-C-C family protein [bacterium]|nr:C-GCAxxG-C-C family protein [bacterium]
MEGDALAFFARGYNCAEAVVLAAEKALGLPPQSAAPAATALGGGLAGTGSTCGALTGALMALGLAGGPRDTADKERNEALLARGRALIDAFRAEFGEVNCSHLTGYELPGQYRAFAADRGRRDRCRRLVAFAADWAAENCTGGGVRAGPPAPDAGTE